MRPRKAFVALIVFAVVAVVGNYGMKQELLPQPAETVAVVAFIFAPMIINGGLIIGHQHLLGKPDGARKNLLTLLGEVSSFLQQ
jgi:hypothetical protein